VWYHHHHRLVLMRPCLQSPACVVHLSVYVYLYLKTGTLLHPTDAVWIRSITTNSYHLLVSHMVAITPVCRGCPGTCRPGGCREGGC
jgi:hypothetical protein